MSFYIREVERKQLTDLGARVIMTFSAYAMCRI